MATVLEDYSICLPPPLKATICSICHGHESDHIEVTIFALPAANVGPAEVGCGVWNLADRSLCYSEAK